jgi:hypothetical protein
MDNTGVNAVKVVQITAQPQATFTGTGADAIGYICVGN